MKQPLELWGNRYQSQKHAIVVSQSSLDRGTAYIYRVASIHFEAAFAGLVAQRDADWQGLLQVALRLFAQSVEARDCQPRRDYPFNLARLHAEWYLGQWLLGIQPDPDLLDRSIAIYVDALWGKHKSLSALPVLPMGLLLAQDRRRLQEFWQMLQEQNDLDRLPAELALWRAVSSLFLAEPDRVTAKDDVYLQAFAGLGRELKDPTAQPAKFYLAAAKIGMEAFGLAGTYHSVLLHFAIEPWLS